MKNRVRKGNYYRLKTKKFYEAEGYSVENLEKTQRIVTRDKDTDEMKTIFIKRDLWGGDLVAANRQEMIWIQVKANKGDITKGLKELQASPLPDCIKKIVVWWPERAREPEIYEL